MNIPSDLLYSTEHEWIRRDGNIVTIGITDYAQDALGDVVFVDTPDMGAVFALGESVGEIESTKSVSDFYSPLTGVVTAINGNLEDNPELLNSDPYGEGWICSIEISDDSELGQLMDAVSYRQITEG